jgi:hypothetical protein
MIEIGYRTIPEGRRVAVHDNKTGRVSFVDGPQRLWLWGQNVVELKSYAASPDQYLVVKFKDGRRLHRAGPTATWFDPVQHEAIEVEPAITIDAHEAVVVYRRQQDRVERHVLRGPRVFVPQENEWLHEFRWHGADPKDHRRKVPRGLVFTKLRVIPDQMYFDVEDVRTADDALLVIKLMIFFELVDVDVMLDQTHDPVADFINAVSADVIDFAATQTFERFKENTERLNDLATYRQLVQRAERIGYRVNKVVYRGYHANPKLQAMHDNAIETRTRLRLEAETEEQAQAIADLKVNRERDRANRRQEMEQAEAQHKLRMQRAEHEEQARRQQAEQDADLEGKRRAYELEENHQAAMNGQQVALLHSMQGMQVDLTRYLVAQYQHPDRFIRIDGPFGDGNGQLHLHDRMTS